ncbi:monooxygenase, partial [Mycolicibacterium diernhoferi]
AQAFAPLVGADPTKYGLPPANHKLFEAHPTQSVELPLRLGSGDVIPKPNISRLDGDTVHFDDGTSDVFDVIIYATGYNITFPFFDPDLISAPENQIRLYKRMFKPGFEDLVFIGFAQAIPTLFPFVECQSRLLAAYASGRYALPPVAEMERVIDADQQLHAGHCTNRARHTQQVDYFYYEHDIRTKEIPAGTKRAAAARPELAPV